MKKLRERVLSWVLTLAMLLTFMPAGLLPTASAAGTGMSVTLSADGKNFEVSITGGKSSGVTGAITFILYPNFNTGANTVEEVMSTVVSNPEHINITHFASLKEYFPADAPVVEQQLSEKRFDNSGNLKFTVPVPEGLSYSDLAAKYGSTPLYFGTSNETATDSASYPYIAFFNSVTDKKVLTAETSFAKPETLDPPSLSATTPVLIQGAEGHDSYTINLENATGCAEASINWTGAVVTDVTKVLTSYSPTSGTLKIAAGETKAGLTLMPDWQAITEEKYFGAVHVSIPYTDAEANLAGTVEVDISFSDGLSPVLQAEPITFNITTTQENTQTAPIKFENTTGLTLVYDENDGGEISYSTASNYALTTNIVSGDTISSEQKNVIAPAYSSSIFPNLGTYQTQMTIPTRDKESGGSYPYISVPITINVTDASDPGPTTYSVTFNENKPSGAGTVSNMPSNQTGVASGTTIDYPSPAPTLSGYTFQGWATTTDGEASWTSGSRTITADTTFYAVWQQDAPPTYTATINTRVGGAAANVESVKLKNATATSAALTLGATGVYTLASVPNDTSYTTAVVKTASGTYEVALGTAISSDHLSETVNLYTISLGTKPAGISAMTIAGDAGPVIAPEGTKVTLAATAETDKGYTLGAWSKGEEDLGVLDGSTFTVGKGNATLTPSVTTSSKLVASPTPVSAQKTAGYQEFDILAASMDDGKTGGWVKNTWPKTTGTLETVVTNGATFKDASDADGFAAKVTAALTSGTALEQNAGTGLKITIADAVGIGDNYVAYVWVTDGTVHSEAVKVEFTVKAQGEATATGDFTWDTYTESVNHDGTTKTHTVTFELADLKEISSIKMGNTALTSGTHYTVGEVKEGKVTITLTKTYLEALTSGGTLVIEGKTGSNNTKSATVQITLEDTMPKLDKVTLDNVTDGVWTIGGTAPAVSSITAVPGSASITTPPADSTGTVSYTWAVNGKILQGETGSTLGADAVKNLKIGDFVTVTVTGNGKPGDSKPDGSDSYTGARSASFKVAARTFTVTTKIMVDGMEYSYNDTDITATAAASSVTEGQGTSLTTALRPNVTGYKFIKWTVDNVSTGTLIGENNTTAFFLPTADATVTANWDAVPILGLTDGTAGPGEAYRGNLTNLGKGDATEVMGALSGTNADVFDVTVVGDAGKGITVPAVTEENGPAVVVKPKTDATLTPGTTYTATLTITDKEGEEIVRYVSYTYQPTYTVTIAKDPNTASATGKYGLDTATAGAADGADKITVTYPGTVALDAAAATGYKFDKWTATTEAGAFPGGDAAIAKNAYQPKGDVTLTATSKAVTDLSLTPPSGTASQSVNYTGTPTVYTGTLSNNGAKEASVSYVLSEQKKDGTTEGTYFTIAAPALSDNKATIAGRTATATTQSVTVNAATALGVGKYTATLTITEQTTAADTMNGAKTWTVPITFLVTAAETFDGTVKVKLDDAFKNSEKVVLHPDSEGDGKKDITLTVSGATYGENTYGTATKLSNKETYSILLNDVDTGLDLTAAKSSQTVQLWTLTLETAQTNKPTASGATEFTVTDGKGYVSGSTVVVTAAANTGYAFSHWTSTDITIPNNDKGKNPYSVTMTKATGLTANYIQSLGIKYLMNAGDTTTVFVVDNGPYTGTETAIPGIKLTSAVPTRTDYVFKGWGTATDTEAKSAMDSGTAHAASDLGTAANGYYTLYAIWEAVTVSWPDSYKATVTDGTYGELYADTVAGAESNGGTVTYAEKDGKLSSMGLKLNPDGTITGKPFKTYVGDSDKLTFTVTATAGTATATHTFTLNVAKATPVLTVTEIQGVTSGGATNGDTVKVVATVTAPYYGGESTGWTTTVDKYNTVEATAPHTGAVAITSPEKFNVTGTTDTTVTYTPGTTVATGVTGQKYGDIYNTVTAPFTTTLGATTYTVTVNPNPHAFDSITVGTTMPTAQTFTVTNAGNVSTHLTYELVDAKGVAYSDAKFTLAGNQTETIAVGAGDTFTITPKGITTAGTYTVYVKLTNYDKAVSESDKAAKFTVIVPVTLEVKDPTNFQVVLTTRSQAVGADTPTAANIHDIRLVSLADSTKVLAPDANPTDGAYKWTGDNNKPAYGSLYKVQVKYADGDAWRDVPNMTVQAGDATQNVDFYQLKLDGYNDTDSKAITKDLTFSAAHEKYFLEGETMLVSVTDTDTTRTFVKWQDGDKQAAGAEKAQAFTYTMPKAPKTLTAHFQTVANTFSVTYDAGAYTPDAGDAKSAPNTVAVPADSTAYASNDTVTVKPGTVLWPGYTFLGWSLDSTRKASAFNTGDNAGKDFSVAEIADTSEENKANKQFTITTHTTLYGVWQKIADADVTWPVLDNTVYGSSYLTSVAPGNAGTLGIVKYEIKDGKLPGGLVLNPSTGVVGEKADGKTPGRPYETGTFAFTVVATNADGSTWEHAFTDFKVDKYTPTLTAISIGNATKGGQVSAAKPYGTVTAPYYDGKDWTDDKAFTYASEGTLNPNPGALSITAPTENFANAESEKTTVKFTPSDTVTTGVTGQKFNAIYKEVTADYILNFGGTKYAIEVDPGAQTFTVELNGSTYTPADKAFKVTNKGDNTAYVTYTLGGTDAAKFTLEPSYDSEKTYQTVTTTGTGTTFKVTPKFDTAVGTYSATVTVTSYASADDVGKSGTAKTTQTVALTLVVSTPKSFAAKVSTWTTATTDNAHQAYIGYTGVRLVPVNGSSESADGALTGAITSDNHYRFATAVSGGTAAAPDYNTSYSVWVQSGSTWSKVPGVVVSKDNATVDVDRFQLTLAQAPAAEAELKLNDVKTQDAYFFKGETVKVSTTVPEGYSLTNWTKPATPNPEPVSTDAIFNHTMNAAYALTANFATITSYTVEFKLDGGKLDNGDAIDYAKLLGTGATAATTFPTGSTIAVNTPAVGGYAMTKTGYTFQGWALTGGDKGGYTFTANEASDKADSATADQKIVLVALWSQNSDLAFTDAVIEGTYKHAIDKSKGGTASGGDTSYAYKVQEGDTLPFTLALDSNASSVSGTPDDVGTDTARVVVTDAKGDTATATYTFVIGKADVKPNASKGLPTDAIEIAVGTAAEASKKAITDELEKAQMDGDGTGETAINGAWTVDTAWTLPTAPGTYDVPVVFTPANVSNAGDHTAKDGDHYNTYTATVKVKVTAKLITHTDVKFNFPKATEKAAEVTGVTVPAATIAGASADADAITAALEVKSITWDVGMNSDGKFNANSAYAVTVVLSAKSGYAFAASDAYTAKFMDDHATGAAADIGNDKLTVLTNGATAILQYTWPAEDQAVQKIQVTVTKPTVGATPDKTVNIQGQPLGSFIVDSKTTKWVKAGLSTITSENYSTQSDNTDAFEADQKYTAIITADKATGWTFPTEDGKPFAALNGSNANATVNNSNAKVLAKSANRVVIAVEFTPENDPVNAIVSAAGPLNYYAWTDATAKHHDTSATGNASISGTPVSAEFAANTAFTVQAITKGGTVVTVNAADFKLYADKDGDSKLDTTKDTLLTGHTFKNYDPNHDVKDFHGKDVYVVYAPGGTASSSVPAFKAGTLTVNLLRADSIAQTGDVPVLDYTGAAKAFAEGTATKATVTFNTGSALANEKAEMIWAAKATATASTAPSYYYEYGAANQPLTGAGTDLTEIKVGDTMTAAMNGQTLYMTYTDVNGNTVRTPVGVLKTSSAFTVEVTDANGGDPEYGDKITAKPNPDGDYTYQWETKGDENKWIPIPGGDGSTYVPTKDDIDKTIRVTVTDKKTGTEVFSTELTIQKRSLNFTVSVQNKVYDGDALNKHSYTATDFALIQVPAGSDPITNPAYGGVMAGDTVTLTPGDWNKTDASRPAYADKTVGSTITWPAIVTGEGVTSGHIGGYTLSDADHYRLAAQGTQANRGEITNGTVQLVTAHFKGQPVVDGTIPAAPETVARADQNTWPSGSGYTAKWYTDYKEETHTGTPAGSTFAAGKAYTVEIKVKAANGWSYQVNTPAQNGDTQFLITTGATGDTSFAAKAYHASGDDKGVYTMYYTFPATTNPAASIPAEAELTNTLYYAQTATHKDKNTADNTTIPGGKQDIGFTIDLAGLSGVEITYADNTTKTLDTATTGSAADQLYYTKDWSLVAGDDATVTVPVPAAFTKAELSKFDGKHVYVKVGDVVLTDDVGTLTVKELTAETLTATGTLKLSYTVNDKFDAAGITKATVVFNTDSMNVTYEGAQRADNATNSNGTKYYFELGENTPLVSGTTALSKSENGKLVYICYTDVNGHEVRTPLGTLAVGDPAATTAAIQVRNQTRANKDTQYGDILQAVVTGTTNSGADLEYQWQSRAMSGTDVDWVNISGATAASYTVSKDDVGKFLRVQLTKDGGKVITTQPASDATATGVDMTGLKDSNDHIYADKKTITAEWTWTPGSKTWDGTAAAAPGEGGKNFTYGATAFNAQLVTDKSGTKDSITLTKVTAAAFANADAGYNKPITLTGGALPTDGNNWANYYTLKTVAPTGSITKLQLGWDDFTFTGKVKQYDGTTDVYATDNFSLTAANSGDKLTSNVDSTKGLWAVNTEKITDTGVQTAIAAAVKANSVAYTSAASLEGRDAPIAQAGDKAKGHSTITLTLASSNSNIAAPTGSYSVKSSAINPKQVTVDADALTAPSFSKDATAVVVDGKVQASDLASGDADVKFQVQGQVAAHETTATGAEVTIIGVTKGTSAGINWSNNSYKLVWGDKSAINGTITGGAPTGATVKEGTKAVYGDSFAEVTGLSVEVTFEGNTKQTFTSFAALKNQGIVAVVEHDTNSNGSTLEYSFTDSAKVGWDGSSNTTAAVSFKLFKAADATAADSNTWSKTPLGAGTITVSQRPLNVTPAWSLAANGKAGKFYDGSHQALGAVNDATDSDLSKTVTGAMSFTYGNKGFSTDTVAVNTAGKYAALFADANAADGKSITVTLDDTPFTGAQANRYKAGTVDKAVGTIKARPIQVTFDGPTVAIDKTDVNKKVNLSQVFQTDVTISGSKETLAVAATGTYQTVAKVITAGVGDGVGNVAVTLPIWSDTNYAVTVKTPINGSVSSSVVGAVAITYEKPVKGALTTAAGYVSPKTFSSSTQVKITATQWNTVASATDLTGSGAVTGNKFEAGKFYMVTATVTPQDGFSFDANTQFTLNDGTMKKDGTKPANMSVTIAANGTATVKYIFSVAADSTVIAHVAADIPLPAVGSDPTSSESKASKTTSVLTDENGVVAPDTGLSAADPAITWKVKDESTGEWGTISNGSKFESGRAYQATLTYTVGSGYSFAADADFTIKGVGPAKGSGTLNTAGTPVTVNGVTVTAKETAAKTTYVLTVEFPKTGSQNVTNVIINTAPLPPAAGDTIPSAYVVGTEPYEDTGSIQWQVSDNGTDNWTKVTVGAEFEAGKYYRVTGTVALKADKTANYDITGETKFFIGTLGSVAIPQTATSATKPEGANYTVLFAPSKSAVDGVYSDDTTYTLTLSYDKLEDTRDKVIVKIAANVAQPTSNDTVPDTSAAVDKAVLLLAQNKDGQDMTEGVVKSNVKWYKGTEPAAAALADDPDIEQKFTWGDPLDAGTPFIKGATYKVTFNVAADTNNHYKLLADDTNEEFVKYLVNSILNDQDSWFNGEDMGQLGRIAAATAVADTVDKQSYHVSVYFQDVSEKADVFSVWGKAMAPKAGVTAAPGQISVLNADEPYELVAGSNKWYSDAACTTEFTGQFKAGETYYAKLQVQAKEHYQFLHNASGISTSGYINDTDAGTTVAYQTGTGSAANPQYITLVRAFTVPEIQVNVRVSSVLPVGGVDDVSATNASITLPDGVKGYELENGKWYNADGTTPAAKFEAGETYKLVVTVRPKDADGDKYALPSEKNGYSWDEGYRIAASITETAKDSGVYKAVFEYKIPGAGVTGDIMVAVDKDSIKKGHKAPEATSPNSSVEIVDTTWSGNKQTDVQPNEMTFTDGQTYTVKVTIKGEDKNGNPIQVGDKVYINGKDVEIKDDMSDGKGNWIIQDSWTIPKEGDTIINGGGGSGGGGGGGGGAVSTEIVVTYWIGETGVTDDLTAEKVEKNDSPSNVPKVKGLNKYEFKGWSETDPAKLKNGEKPKLVDPTTFKITEDKTFYAVYTLGDHTINDHVHYVIGYPNGTFGPADDITRGSVATIIARAVLPGFVEGSDYGNPGNYSDVTGNWAASAIAYCTTHNVFNGYDDGTFRPNQPITRQEFALVMARLDGVQASQGVPFNDIGAAGAWAVDGIYTAYAKGWINGYPDGSFKPLNNIRRDEAVKIFNAYLHRGVDAEGLSDLTPFVHTGAASNNGENGSTEYMVWPDVPQTQWAYYEIIEAANDHSCYYPDEPDNMPPEHWTNVWIDEVWQYHDASSSD